MNSTPILLFDGECRMCIQLAEFVRRRSDGLMDVRSWQVWQQECEAELTPSNIGMVIGDEVLSGQEAWEKLIELHPDLTALNWLAEKLGMKSALAVAVSSAANLAKRVCGHCRMPWHLRNSHK